MIILFRNSIAMLFAVVFGNSGFTGCVSSAPAASKAVIASRGQSFNMELKLVVGSQTVHLVIKKPIGKRVCITFRAPYGYALDRFFTDRDAPNVEQDFNFTDAQEGVYSVEICDRERTITKKIKLERSNQVVTTQLVVL